MARRTGRNDRPPQRSNQRPPEPRRAPEAETEPMRRYIHPIPQPTSPLPSRSEADLPGTVTQILEQQACQTQLLMDLLGAVNSLTAALLCRGRRDT